MERSWGAMAAVNGDLTAPALVPPPPPVCYLIHRYGGSHAKMGGEPDHGRKVVTRCWFEGQAVYSPKDSTGRSPTAWSPKGTTET